MSLESPKNNRVWLRKAVIGKNEEILYKFGEL